MASAVVAPCLAELEPPDPYQVLDLVGPCWCWEVTTLLAALVPLQRVRATGLQILQRAVDLYTALLASAEPEGLLMKWLEVAADP